MRIPHVVIGSVVALAALACVQVVDRLNTRFVNPHGLLPSSQYTHVVETTGGLTVYIAGQAALDAEGHLVGPGDFRAQARQVFENLRTALESVGGELRHVVKMTMYVTNMSELQTLREVRGEFMADPPPATTLVQVVSLAREDFLLEIEAIAVLPARTES